MGDMHKKKLKGNVALIQVLKKYEYIVMLSDLSSEARSFNKPQLYQYGLHPVLLTPA